MRRVHTVHIVHVTVPVAPRLTYRKVRSNSPFLTTVAVRDIYQQFKREILSRSTGRSRQHRQGVDHAYPDQRNNRNSVHQQPIPTAAITGTTSPGQRFILALNIIPSSRVLGLPHPKQQSRKLATI